MKYHVGVNIERALELLASGKNIFTGTPSEAMRDLITARNIGCKVYTGCDNINEIGSCLGHEDDSATTTPSN